MIGMRNKERHCSAYTFCEREVEQLLRDIGEALDILEKAKDLAEKNQLEGAQQAIIQSDELSVLPLAVARSLQRNRMLSIFKYSPQTT